jgi:WD40 repeat protein
MGGEAAATMSPAEPNGSVGLPESRDTVNPLADEQRAGTLVALRGALRREAHVLTRNPDLLWQQLYNRLQWEDEPVPALLAPELKRRSGPMARPWLRLATPHRESGAVVRTLAGHTKTVAACAFSPDGRLIVSASFDGTLRLWDVTTGQSLRTLEGHAWYVNTCAFSVDGRRIVSGGNDKTLRIWDAASGACLRILLSFVI